MKRLLSDTAREVLENNGWHETRDVYEELEFPDGKEVFEFMRRTVGSFALLEIKYAGPDGDETLYFDVDDSYVAQNMRARIWGYADINSPEIEFDREFSPLEDLNETNRVSKSIGRKCMRMGFLDDGLGFEIYIADNGSVYLDHGGRPFMVSNSYYGFLNSQILSKCSRK